MSGLRAEQTALPVVGERRRCLSAVVREESAKRVTESDPLIVPVVRRRSVGADEEAEAEDGVEAGATIRLAARAGQLGGRAPCSVRGQRVERSHSAVERQGCEPLVVSTQLGINVVTEVRQKPSEGASRAARD